MCSRPFTFNRDGLEQVIACRKCNQCLVARRNDWIARAMAESNTNKNTMILGLTYSNENHHSATGAKVFRYSDITLFIKSLRRQIKYHYGNQGTLRYIVCGENGSKKGRVHWHVLLFTQENLFNLGKWTDFHTKEDITNKDDTEKQEKRVNWSMWKHGHSYLQQADQGGIQYALKYAFKDQFNIVQSQGTMRQTEAENYSSSFFRMSREPAIGFDFMQNKLERLRALGAVVPNLNITIPDYAGFWYPKGKMRNHYIDGLRMINTERILKTGKPAPQMAALIQTLESVSNPNDLERLKYGEQKEDFEDFEDGTFERNLELAARENAATAQHYAQRRNCSQILPCNKCQLGLDQEETHKFTEWARSIVQKQKNTVDFARLVHKDEQGKRTCNPFCKFKDAPHVIAAFKPFA